MQEIQTEKKQQPDDGRNQPDAVRKAVPELAGHERKAFDMLQQARCAVDQLALERTRLKMSNSRVRGIAKELGELVKVLEIAIC